MHILLIVLQNRYSGIHFTRSCNTESSTLLCTCDQGFTDFTFPAWLVDYNNLFSSIGKCIYFRSGRKQRKIRFPTQVWNTFRFGVDIFIEAICEQKKTTLCAKALRLKSTFLICRKNRSIFEIALNKLEILENFKFWIFIMKSSRKKFYYYCTNHCSNR